MRGVGVINFYNPNGGEDINFYNLIEGGVNIYKIF